MDIKRFARERKNREEPEQTVEQTLEHTVEELGKKSESELMEQLQQEVARGKRDGSFHAQALAEFTEKVAPMLSEEQKQRLETLSAQLKL